MTDRIATVIGATGLIGNQLVELLQSDDYFNKIRVVVRRPVTFNNPAIETRIIDFTNMAAFTMSVEGSDTVFCAVGTTNKKVKGDKAEYRKVDYDIPVNAAHSCVETGVKKFILVSSVGANSRSNNFYLKLKGEVEDTLKNMNIETVAIFRPSMLLGERKEFRAGELLGKALAVPLSFLFPRNFRPIHGRNVAKAMIAAAKKHEPGFRIFHYKEMLDLLS